MVCFTLIYLAPGDPLQTLLPENASAETIDMVKKAYGLDKPVPLQYCIWLGRAVTGDLGMSIASGRQVSEEIFKALGNTLRLSLCAIGLSFSLAFVLGTVAGYLHGSWADRLVTGAC
jgi:peptide/nickel transport system permease protein